MKYSANDRNAVIVCIAVVLVIGLLWSTLPEEHCIDDHRHQKNCIKSESNRKYRCDEKPLLLLVSFDGFRWDYLERVHNTPNLRWLIKNGVFSPTGLKNSYITITAPNHYGIVTGLHEESHGIIANNFYDPLLNKTFDYFNDGNVTDPAFFEAEPIWVTNLKSPEPYRGSGCSMWVGCELPLKGHYPTYHLPYDPDMVWEDRVNTLISWFKHPRKPINLGLLYIEEPDKTGHSYGPDDQALYRMVERLDHLVGYLLFRLFSENLLHRLNLIFTADHGMASVPSTNVVNLDEFVNSSWYTVYGGSPNLNVLPKPGLEHSIYDKLKNRSQHMKVYRKEEIPNEYHYKSSPRVMPLQIEAALHWQLSYGKDTTNGVVANQPSVTGAHGYNNSLEDMHPFFIAYGPVFKPGFNISQFDSIDLYLLMCYVLKIQPLPNNGSFSTVRFALKDEGSRWNSYLRGFELNLSNKHDFYIVPLEMNQWTCLVLFAFVVVAIVVAYIHYRSVQTARRSFREPVV